MMQIRLLIKLLLISLPAILQPLQAEQLYRFDNRDGIPTLSTTLPPWAVRQGYDVLDADSMRLLDSVPPEPSAQTRARLRQQQADEVQAARQAEKQAKATERQRRKQQLKNRTLMLTYESEAMLIAARDHDLACRQKTIESQLDKQDDLKQRLFKLQQQAADQQLKAQAVTDDLAKKLESARQQLMFNRNSVSTLQAQLEQLESEYAEDLQRYRQMRSAN